MGKPETGGGSSLELGAVALECDVGKASLNRAVAN
jgi:hypothetical protein